MCRIVFVLLFSMCAFAAESKDLAFRAEKALKTGKFSKANALYERALLSSRKESDLKSEGRILIAMANLRTQSLDLEFAERLLSSVRKAELDTVTLSAYYLAWNILCVSAVAFAGKGEARVSESYLNDGELAFGGDAPGTLAFAAARSAGILQKPEADSLYGVALERSIRAGRPFMSATILYYRGLNEKRPQIAKDYFVRSANAFELMGLPKNSRRAKALGEKP